VNRKLVRPNLAEIKERLSTPRPAPAAPAPVAPAPSASQQQPDRESAAPAQHPASNPGSGPSNAMRRRPVPPEQTSAEAFYYLKQMNGRTPMVVVLDNDEQLRGHIEWYDRSCIKVNREDGPNLLVFKHSIKYLYKQEEEAGANAAGSNGGSSE